MPARTRKQQRYMGAELRRKQRGQKTRTGMSEEKLREHAHKPKGGYHRQKKG